MTNLDGQFEIPIYKEDPDYGGRGFKSFLLGLGGCLVLLAMSWLLFSYAGSLAAAKEIGIKGWSNFFLITFAYLSGLGCLIAALGSFLVGANAWGRDRVRKSRVAQGEMDEEPQQLDPMILLGAAGAVFVFSVSQSHEVIVISGLGVAFVLFLFSVVRIVLNLMKPEGRGR